MAADPTPAERDVALMAIEGFSIAGNAAPRQTGAGAVKAQCAGVCAEAGVTGRPRLLGLFIDEPTDDGLSGAAPAGR
ncbi:MAG TPA: hypothetical protein VMM55_13235 [Thermohalobaculum sp.]|nr:hypothetical protein [Thermohalobaculum sp.]